jgi:leucyl/phenylalanyl-tRNA--protein transferase
MSGVIPWLRGDAPFPPVDGARDDLGGLLAAGGDLSPRRLLDAYARGIFPWHSDDEPILWWSPDPRMVLYVDEFHVSHSLARRLRRGEYEIRVDTAFEAVMRACAAPRPGHDGTWIQEEMIEAYVRLHRLGYAHSVESWRAGELVGGLYGVALGRVFFGESMFAHADDASKVALAHLVAMQRANDAPLIDCQMETKHLASLGARPIPRTEFVRELRRLVGND